MTAQSTFRTIQVGLLWHSLSSDNLGVGALTESQIAILRSAAESAGFRLEFTVFGTSGSRTGLNNAPGVTIGDRLSYKRMLVGKTRYLAQLKACNIVLDIGEGDSFTDIYGGERFRMQAFAKWLALMLGKPLVLSPQTIGPFEGRWTRLIATGLMKRCKRVYARDVLSSDYLAELGLRNNVAEAIDVAFRLPFQKRQLPGTGKFRIGINVSGLLYHGGYSGKNQFGLTVDYKELTNHLIEYFIARGDCEIHLVGHVITELVGNEDDYSVSCQLAERYPGLVVAEKFNSPGAAKGYIAAMDYFTGARMHACIAAFSSGVPVTPLAYSRKFQGLFSTLGYQQVVDCKATTTEQAFTMVVDGFERREQLQATIATGNQLALQKLQHYEDYLAECLRNVQHAVN
ncbi:MAG: polysaccharide pyruvyl transferase family protein [Pseudomonadota bacterium]